MLSWTYRNYATSIKKDVEFGVMKRGYTLIEAIGFAHSELELRIEALPEEAPMALIALAACALREGVFGVFERDELFLSDLRGVVVIESVENIIKTLPSDEVGGFREDFEVVARALNKL
ncbi:hypothetical protein GO998_19845 (plasmid) [Ralstonia syzygii]|uniref:Uncharacterized protein n=1 Tax=Ralstonia syzygii TaxID=28097 RepID=A0ABX7ZKJ0_9RALS|nr:hypothetical protein [Ralstonia syzygii]QUP55978.1 hypothetical protein GO998_19845 [Ralstonia syzygii]